MNGICPERGTPLQREPGYYLGSTNINYGVTALVTTASYVLLHYVVGWSNRAVLPVLLILA